MPVFRYNKANGTLVGIAERSRRRPVAGGGRLVRDAERADEGRVRVQEYNGFPPTNIRNGGKFHGLMLEGVIGF